MDGLEINIAVLLGTRWRQGAVLRRVVDIPDDK